MKVITIFRIYLAAVLMSLISLAIAASAPDIDKDLMYFMEEINDKLNSDLAMGRKQESLDGADLMVELSLMVETHFIDWGESEKAIELAAAGKQYAMDIAKSLQTENYDAARRNSIALSNNCKLCHELF